MLIQDSSITDTLIGVKYQVYYHIPKRSSTQYSRGDHGMGGGNYQVVYWSGEVTVRDRSSSMLLAACTCGINSSRSFGKSSSDIQRLVFGEAYYNDFLAEYRAIYADMVGKKVIEFFRNSEAKGIPYVEVEPFSKEELVQFGLMADENDQVNLVL